MMLALVAQFDYPPSEQEVPMPTNEGTKSGLKIEDVNSSKKRKTK
jgi:hypothetical protein